MQDLPRLVQAEGLLEGPGVRRYEKRYGEIKGIYLREDKNLPDAALMYEVYTLEGEGEGSPLLLGMTVMQPVSVAGEYNMTRGHFHQDRVKPEIYIGCAGEGTLLLMDEAGDCRSEEIRPHSVHYIPGHLAHRIINTGSAILKVMACWERVAGHDYRAIEEHPFPRRFFRQEDKV